MVNMNRIVIARAWAAIKNDQGGLNPIEIGSWQMFAAIEDRAGSSSSPYNQEIWTYDYRITIRYAPSRVIGSNYTIDYDGKTLKINSIASKTEGFKHYSVLRCSVIDNSVSTGGSGSNPPLPQIRSYIFTATGGETSFSALPGKQVFSVSKDGIVFDIITTGTLNPLNKEVKITAGQTFEFLIPFAAGETANVLYIN
jgi:head-tail adaptor